MLLLDEPFGALDATVRKELRAWLRRLHDEVHVTTVFVTHDQEEAMEVAEQIVVLNHGEIEQVGTPRELYEQAGQRVRDALRRPGERALGPLDPPARRRDPARAADGAAEAQVDRIVHLGFEVRVELSLGERRVDLGADHPRPGGGARAERGPDRLAAARGGARSASEPRVGRLGEPPDARGQAPAATSASVTSSRTERRLARTAIQTVCRCSAEPW